jgi:Tfp pilus assembly protein PilO
MKLTEREAILGVITLAALLLGGAAILAKPRIEQWKSLRTKQADVRAAVDADVRILDERPKWQARYEAVSRKLERLASDKRPDAYWLAIMDRTASANSLNISKRQALEERNMGDVYELPLDCQWEGSLPSLVHFLFDLQSQGVMFDVRQLLVKPTAKDMLRGRFVLYCAYTRERAEPGSAAAGRAEQ